MACDVSEQLKCKVDALCAYRTQLALEPDMFPEFLMREIFAWEYFEVADTGSTPIGGPTTAPVWTSDFSGRQHRTSPGSSACMARRSAATDAF